MMIETLLSNALGHHLAGGKLRIPEAGRLLWGWFADLSAARSYGAVGPNPIAYADILAFAKLHRWPIEPRHAAVIRSLDRIWLEHARGAPPRSNWAPRPSGQEITPEAFDAVFH
jgi:hypothetical protein